MKYIVAMLFSLILTACGGGGSGSSDNSAPSDTAEASDTPETRPESEATQQRSMEDLNVPDGFNFRNSTQQAITIDLNELTGDSAIVSIYSRFQTLPSGEYLAVGQSKVITSQLTNGKIDLVFQLHGTTGQYLVEIWRRGDVQPLQWLVNRGSQSILE